MTEALDRIAAALERLAPPPVPDADLTAHPAYLWDGRALTAARSFAALPLDTLTGIDQQKAALVSNLGRLAAGHAAHDVLLWGARGTGKSALAAAAAAATGVALVEVATHTLDSLPRLFARMATSPRAFAVFIDDLGFSSPDEARTLRSLLEGGAEARPSTVRLLVTSNRRHLVARDIAEQSGGAINGLPAAGHSAGAGSWNEPRAINPRDVVDDALALADRFGLSLGFHAIDQDTYVAIVAGYARAYGLAFDPQDAIGWATRRGSRSGRVAWQYVVELAGRAGRTLPR
ncbi:ATPase [Sphingomonas sp. Leaf33]|uniref:DUF815 domain-containing protein n=1 Tax=Sphingomonas sp. Leaf33 TaxID=1736215 RepID=UPI0006F93AEE|nr:DUF815 domain-containing protein [Sphingomonas sp. Leaf33]KQN25869.1 ATPase [Sphingomonas sp. Leaf33]